MDDGWQISLDYATLRAASSAGHKFQSQFQFWLAVVILHEFSHWKRFYFKKEATPEKMRMANAAEKKIPDSGFCFEAHCFGGYFEPGTLVSVDPPLPCLLFMPENTGEKMHLVPPEWITEVVCGAASASVDLLGQRWQSWPQLERGEYRLRHPRDPRQWRTAEPDVEEPLYYTANGEPLYTCLGVLHFPKET
eukprot:TRINITY_DN391_c1_g3_i1.p2 TRINITY_DN391_c1_g3~~TRINITY_DN391_c1_g3_i1.p2  ORF type:complete len:192 (-),score=25.43 TRINITY_DN391_c1_g3_i1:203-778(-)